MNRMKASSFKPYMYLNIIIFSFLFLNTNTIYAQGNINVSTVTVPGSTSECGATIVAQFKICNIGYDLFGSELNLSSGIYIYRLTQGANVSVKKMTLLK